MSESDSGGLPHSSAGDGEPGFSPTAQSPTASESWSPEAHRDGEPRQEGRGPNASRDMGTDPASRQERTATRTEASKGPSGVGASRLGS